MEAGSHAQTDPTNIGIWSHLRSLGACGWKISLQFIFSHCDIPANDAADAAAGTACSLGLEYHAGVPLAKSCALARLKRVLWRQWGNACDPGNQYSGWLCGCRAPRLEGLTRRAEIEVRRLRTGHHALLRPYLSRSVFHSASQEERATITRACPHCSRPSSLRHLFLDCLGGNALAARLMFLPGNLRAWAGAPGPPATILRELLFCRPDLALAYLQEAGFLGKFSTSLSPPASRPAGSHAAVL